MIHAMLDFETMGLSETSAIIQAGACVFSIETGAVLSEFQRGINLVNEQELGFTIDASTVLWWMGQRKEAQESVLRCEVSSFTAFRELTVFLDGADFIWTKGNLDPLWLAHHQKVLGLPLTPHQKFVNLRTLDALGMDLVKVENVGVTHTALDDCRYQVKQLISCLNL